MGGCDEGDEAMGATTLAELRITAGLRTAVVMGSVFFITLQIAGLLS